MSSLFTSDLHDYQQVDAHEGAGVADNEGTGGIREEELDAD